ncbi:MAG: hypothetical protein QOH41_4290 [Blastocatellia bacterium]|nr:hypothetical protein [Blastocatellia bacterium]
MLISPDRTSLLVKDHVSSLSISRRHTAPSEAPRSESRATIARPIWGAHAPPRANCGAPAAIPLNVQVRDGEGAVGPSRTGIAREARALPRRCSFSLQEMQQRSILNAYHNLGPRRVRELNDSSLTLIREGPLDGKFQDS